MEATSLILERVGALVQQSLRDDAARHGLLPIHLQILSYLERANRYSDLPIAVAEFLGITRGTVSQSLQLLERQGLLVKQADPEHGRRVRLVLTRAGKALVRDSWSRRLQTALEALPPDARPLDDALRGLLVALQRQNGQRAFGTCKRCVHFSSTPRGGRCGLTGEPLARAQTERICREWKSPAAAGEVAAQA